MDRILPHCTTEAADVHRRQDGDLLPPRSGCRLRTNGPRPGHSSITPSCPPTTRRPRIAATIAETAGARVHEVLVVTTQRPTTPRRCAATWGDVIRNATRLGYVGSVKRGFAAASATSSSPWMPTARCRVEMIGALVAPIAAGTADMVQGHRSRVPRRSERVITAIAASADPWGTRARASAPSGPASARELEIPGLVCICGSLRARCPRARRAALPRSRSIARPVAGRRRRIAWNHLSQAVLVAAMASRARLVPARWASCWLALSSGLCRGRRRIRAGRPVDSRPSFQRSEGSGRLRPGPDRGHP